MKKTVFFLSSCLAVSTLADTVLNIDSICNRNLEDTPLVRGWIEDSGYSSLGKIPVSDMPCGNVTFRIPANKRFLLLCGVKRQLQSTGSVTLKLPVGNKSSVLNLLHTGGWIRPDTVLGQIKIVYANGGAETIPVKSGIDVGDWFGIKEYANGAVAYCQYGGNGYDAGAHASSFPLRQDDPTEITFSIRDESALWMILAATLTDKKGEFPHLSSERVYKHPAQSMVAAAPGTGSSYDVILLGDTHYDSLDCHELHDPKITQQFGSAFREEIRRNCGMWEKLAPSLIDAAARKVSTDTAMALQVGDLIQGDCGTVELHRKLCRQATTLLKAKFPQIPLIFAKGNHDYRGPGGNEGFATEMPAFLSKETRVPVSPEGNVAFVKNNDLYVIFDSVSRDIGFIRDQILKHPGVRYIFLAMHYPLIPVPDDNPAWCFLSSADISRAGMIDFLAEHQVIILSGHTHTIGLQRMETEKGSITQLSLNSVYCNPELVELKTIGTGVEQYRFDRTAPAVKKQAEKIHQEFKDALTEFYFADGAGYGVMHVSPSGVTVDYYGGAGNKIQKTFRLR